MGAKIHEFVTHAHMYFEGLSVYGSDEIGYEHMVTVKLRGLGWSPTRL